MRCGGFADLAPLRSCQYDVGHRDHTHAVIHVGPDRQPASNYEAIASALASPICLRARASGLCLTQLRRLTGEEKWKGRLQLRKRKDHFIFTVQSTGEQRRQQNTRDNLMR